jgi:methyltransferase (TIGR00027 family)
MNSTSGFPAGVGTTALGVALVRAEESRRADRLFDDPYADAFLAAAPGAFETEQRAAAEGPGELAAWGAAFWSHAVIRTRFFDDYLLAAAADGVRQVVLLAAGLDTRAFRLPWPDGVHLYELDLPEVLAFKDRVLADRTAVAVCRREALAVDLREDWTDPLLRAGLCPVEPTAWLVEGLLIYLSAEDAASLLTRVGVLSAAGSRLVLEVERLGTDPMRAQARRSPTMQPYARLWKGGLPDAPGWLAGHGWSPQMRDRASVAAGYGRPQTVPSAGGFLVATRT